MEREAVEEGHMLAEAWWTRQGRRALFLPEGVKFNALTFVFMMTNRFNGYRRNPTAPTSGRVPPVDSDAKVLVYMPENGR